MRVSRPDDAVYRAACRQWIFKSAYERHIAQPPVRRPHNQKRPQHGAARLDAGIYYERE